MSQAENTAISLGGNEALALHNLKDIKQKIIFLILKSLVELLVTLWLLKHTTFSYSKKCLSDRFCPR